MSCATDKVGEKIIIDFKGDGPSTNCGIFGAPYIKLTSIKNTGSLVAVGTNAIQWELSSEQPALEYIWDEAEQEAGSGPFYSRVPILDSFYAGCGDSGGTTVLALDADIAIFQSPNYSTSGSPPPYDQWSRITTSSYTIQFRLLLEPYTGCDVDYLATGDASSVIWNYLGTLPINISRTV